MNDAPRALLAENIHASAVEALETDGIRVERLSRALRAEEVAPLARGVDVLGIRSKTRVGAAALTPAAGPLAIGCFCIGTDQVDLASARAAGVPVFNAPFSNTRSVAELILAEIVMLARRVPDRSRKAHGGAWDKSAEGCHEVRGKTLGIVGYGHIGSQVSILAEGFGMRVLYHDIAARLPLGNSRPAASLAELLGEADFVTLHVPDTPQTRGMIGAPEIAAMKTGAHLLNASRGTVVDLPALREAILSGHLAGAAVDVFPKEPESAGEPFASDLQELPNVILTPHIGGSTEEAQESIGREVAARLIQYLRTGSTAGAVNFPQVDLPVHHDSHRILHVHRNVPGVLAQVNRILSGIGANVLAQHLTTEAEIGYLIVDVDREVSVLAAAEIGKLSATIRARVLF